MRFDIPSEQIQKSSKVKINFVISDASSNNKEQKLALKSGDLSNTAATYIGIIAGFVLGGLISWWIYNRQEKTADKQQEILDPKHSDGS